MNLRLALVGFFSFCLSFSSYAEDNHAHQKKKPSIQVKSEKKEDHGDDDEHDHDHEEEAKTGHDGKQAEGGHKHDDEEEAEGHGHGEGEEGENAQVGPTKGILEADEKKGFKLSPEAEKNFGLIRVAVTSNPVEIPKTAVVTAVAEKNIFRVRDGFYKRVDFEEINKQQDKILIQSKDIRRGDEIVVHGLGFLRLAEISAYGGAPEGHSH